MTADRRWARPLAALAGAGVHEHITPTGPGTLDIHAKALVVDDRIAFVGSENLSRASLTADRELGIVTGDPAVVEPVDRTLEADAHMPVGSSVPAGGS